MLRKLTRLTTALALLAPLSGCGKTVAVIATDELCRSWRHQTISKADKLTDATASQIEGNNNARPTWGCQLGENKAKG